MNKIIKLIIKNWGQHEDQNEEIFVVEYENPLKYMCESESSVKHIYFAVPSLFL